MTKKPVNWDDPLNLQKQVAYIAGRIKELETESIPEETKQRLLGILKPAHEKYTARLAELKEAAQS